ncbi:MGH1-like glycoside hydrolase domain-containing protein [Carboxylicivirga sp. RSCT41]|uniref:alpha-L-rhamnosidase-related protein n=1 Tax=Carboxylicivirga agarovorans TaxID=3417570 RepID=UPI003D34B4B7
MKSSIKLISRRVGLLALVLVGVFNSCNTVELDTTKFKYTLNPAFPRFDYFSVDALGKSKLDNSPLILEEIEGQVFTSKTDGYNTSYYLEGNEEKAAWEFILTESGFNLKSNFVENNVPWEIKFDQHKNHITVLGIVPDKNKIETPCVMHLPDMGSFKVRSEQVGILDYTSCRVDVPKKFVQLSFPAATKEQSTVEYSFEIAAIYPELDKIKGDARFDGYRRSFINALQVNPNIKMLANNSSSDACGFVQYGYSEVALQAPPLVDNLRAIDIVGMTLDSYLSGVKSYGEKGYVSDQIFESDLTVWGNQNASLDTYPSLLITACNYYKGTKNTKWLKKNYQGIENWANEIITRDADGDGLIEYGFSGNSGTWSGDHLMRPANWWDCVGFAHKDAYSNALAYRAMKMYAALNEELGEIEKAKQYDAFAEKLKSNYYNTFINPETGVLAGWKSEDGELHDYYFTFVNGIAIAYDVVSKEQGDKIMDNILVKINEVGFSNFELGLPGPLIPIKASDYTHHDPRWGGSLSDETNEGWQHYQNGGTSANFIYFTIRALYQLGRIQDAERILFPLLKGIEDGNFQGVCDDGQTREWQTWNGECTGYEGFLVDSYWAVLAVVENFK